MASRLTTTTIEKMKPPAPGKRKELSDAACPNLVLRITAKNHKSWYFIYRQGGKLKKIYLGDYNKDSNAGYNLETTPPLNLQNAHDAANDLRKHKYAGDNIKDKAVTARKRETFSAVLQEYEQHLKEESQQKPRTAAWNKTKLRYLNKISNGDKTHQIAPWKNIKITQIKKSNVRDLFNQKARTNPVAANRMLACLSGFFKWIIDETNYLGEDAPNPVSGIKRRKEESKDRYLSAKEIALLWPALEELTIPKDFADALKLILVTGQRPGEVLSLHRDQIQNNVWTIPPHVAKNGLPHPVPLSSLALVIIEQQPKTGFLFPAWRKTDCSNTTHELDKRLRRIRPELEKRGISKFTAHDLRATVSTHLAIMGFSEDTISRVLNHKKQSVTSGYIRHQYDEQKEKALLSWAGWLSNIIEPPKQ